MIELTRNGAFVAFVGALILLPSGCGSNPEQTESDWRRVSAPPELVQPRAARPSELRTATDTGDPTPPLPTVQLRPIRSDPFAGGAEPRIRVGDSTAVERPRRDGYDRLDPRGNVLDERGRIVYRAGPSVSTKAPPAEEPLDSHAPPSELIARAETVPRISDARPQRESGPGAKIGGRPGDSDDVIIVERTPTVREQASIIVEHPPSEPAPVEAALPPASPSVEPAPGPARVARQVTYKGKKEREVQRLYKKGMKAMSAERYAKAARYFRRILSSYGDHELGDNALYWLAETAYAQGRWVQALGWFQDLIVRYPSGNKLGDAMVKSALCYAQLGDPDYAARLLEDVETLFPDLPVAGVARERRLALSAEEGG